MKWVLAGGLVVRLIVVVATEGFPFDQLGFVTAERAFAQHGLAAYDYTLDLWPYPPAYFPWLVIADALGAFNHTLRLPAVIADLVLAWLAADLLRRRGASERKCLAAAAVF